jgi:hypothetical protein
MSSTGWSSTPDLCAYAVGERVLAGAHLASTEAQDLRLYDRAYPAFRLVVLHRFKQP